MQNKHYKDSAMQALQVMQTMMTKEQFIGFLLGNEFKYRMRAKFKGQEEADLEKAKDYNYWRFLVLCGFEVDPEKHIRPESWEYKLVL